MPARPEQSDKVNPFPIRKDSLTEVAQQDQRVLLVVGLKDEDREVAALPSTLPQLKAGLETDHEFIIAFELSEKLVFLASCQTATLLLRVDGEEPFRFDIIHKDVQAGPVAGLAE